MGNVVVTYGTFDLFHIGHLNLLRKAKALGDTLIVGLSTDEFNLREKQKVCQIPYQDRKQILEAIKYVDLVIPESTWEQKREDILKYKANTFVMGNDWENHFDFLSDICRVIYLPRTNGISSSEIKHQIKYSSDNKNQIMFG